MAIWSIKQAGGAYEFRHLDQGRAFYGGSTDTLAPLLDWAMDQAQSGDLVVAEGQAFVKLRLAADFPGPSPGPEFGVYTPSAWAGVPGLAEA